MRYLQGQLTSGKLSEDGAESLGGIYLYVEGYIEMGVTLGVPPIIN